MNRLLIGLFAFMLTILASAGTVNNARTGNAGGASTSAANTWSAPQTISQNGAANAPPLYLTGSIFTGGTGTTNFPQLFIQPIGATAVTSWSTNGTAIGVNTASGYTGDLLSLNVAGTNEFVVAGSGVVTAFRINLNENLNIGGKVQNFSNSANAVFDPNANGPAISRNVADANPALAVTQVSASSTGDVLDLSNSATLVFSVNQAGHITTKMTTAPTVGSGSTDCGTAPAIAGNDNNGRVTVGSSTNGGKCTVTFNSAWATAPTCTCNNETTANLCRAASTSTTTVALTGTLTAADKLSYICIGFR